MKTLKENLSIIVCISNDQTRPGMMSIIVDAEKSTMVATNGHILAQAPIELERGESTKVKSLCKEDVSYIKATQKAPWAEIGDHVKDPDGDIPDWQQVVPEKKMEPFICLGVANLEKLVKMARIYLPKE